MKKDENYTPRYTENSLPERFDSWIKKILEGLVYNEVRSCARRMIRQPEFTTEEIDDAAFYDPFSEDELIEVLFGSTPLLLKNKKLAESLGKISKRQQEAIEGTIVLGIPVRVVAKLLGIDEQLVRNYRSRGLDELLVSPQEAGDGLREELAGGEHGRTQAQGQKEARGGHFRGLAHVLPAQGS